MPKAVAHMGVRLKAVGWSEWAAYLSTAEEATLGNAGRVPDNRLG